MKNLLSSLALLVPLNTTKTNCAAAHLVAAEVIREFPKPVLDAMGEAL